MYSKNPFKYLYYIIKTYHKDPAKRYSLGSVLAENEADAWISLEEYVKNHKRDITVYRDRKCVGKIVYAYDPETPLPISQEY